MKPATALAPSNPAMNLATTVPATAGAADEAALVARARAGDAGAFRVLVERHQDRALGLAGRMLRSPEDALDVTQEAFVRAWQALPGFRGDSSFGTWLHSIVARRALDRAESMQRRARRERPLEAIEFRAADAAATEAGDVLGARRLAALIERLSPSQRASVTLYYRDGLAVEDVARMLGQPVNTVKTHLSRARAALREAWLAGPEGESS